MYFRLPILLVLIAAFLVGFFYFTTKHLSKGESPQRSTSTPESRLRPERSADSLKLDRTSEDEALSSINENELRSHVEFLANDLLEGRDTASKGAQIAAAYIANQFRRVGLHPAGENESYFQSVPLHRSAMLPESRVAVSVDSFYYPFDYGEDFFIIGRPAKDTTELNAELVFAGFGIQAPDYGYDDFEGIDVRGKIIVHFSGEPSSDDEDFFEGDKRSPYAQGAAKRRTAQRLGALGSITIADRSTLERISWSSLSTFFTGFDYSLEQEATERPSSFFPTVFLHPDAAEILFSEVEHSVTDLADSVTNGRFQSFDLGKRAAITVLAEEQMIIDQNVVGLLEGSDATLDSEVVVFTAHYDHVGIGTSVRGDSIYNGAADNASGVSALIELAEAYSDLPSRPRRSVLFLAVTAEEKGLLGSEYYTNNPVIPIANTVANINLDMLGVGDTTGIVVYGMERSSLGEVIAEAAREVDLAILPDEMPEQRVFYRSDHYNFAKKGVPAIYPSFGLKKQNFDEFQSYYHQPNDDPDLPFDYRYMKKHVQAVFLTGLRVANESSRPGWKPGDEFEDAGQN